MGGLPRAAAFGLALVGMGVGLLSSAIESALNSVAAIDSSPASDVDGTGANLLRNPSFEEVVDGVPAAWAKYGGEWTAIATEPEGGVVVQLRSSTSSTKWIHQLVPLSGSDGLLRARVAARVVGPGEAFLRLSWYESADGSGPAISQDESELAATGPEWTELVIGPLPPPSGAQSVRIRLMLRPTAGAEEVLAQFDDAYLGYALEPGTATAEPTETPGEEASPTPTAGPATATPTIALPPTALVNPGFEETEAAGMPVAWTKYGGLAGTGSGAFEGALAASLSSDTASTKWLFQTVSVRPSHWYEASGWFRVDGPGEAFLRVSWYASEDGSGSALASDDSPPTSSAEWTELRTGPLQAPAEARSARIRLMLRPQGSEPVTAWFDAVDWRPAGPPTPTPTATPTPTSTTTPTAAPHETATPSPTAGGDEVAGTALVAGDFEGLWAADLGPWRKYGGELDVTSAAFSGSAALALRSQSSSTKWAYQVVLVEPGRWYELRAMARIEGEGEAFLRVSWYASTDGTGSELGHADSMASVTSGPWSPLATGPIQAPAAARSARVRLMLRPASPAPVTAFFDDVQFEETAPPPSPTPTATPTPRPRRTPAPRTPVVRATSTPPAQVPSGLANPGFEETTNGQPAGWSKYGGELASTADAFEGDWAAQLTSSTNSTKWLYQLIRVEGGRWYAAGAMARVEGGEATVRLSWYATEDGSGRAIAQSASEPSASHEWAELRVGPVEAPAEARSVRLRLTLRPTAPSAVAVFDEAWFAEVSPPSTPTEEPAHETPPADEPTVIPAPAVTDRVRNASFEELDEGAPAHWRRYGGTVRSAEPGFDGERAAALDSSTASTKWLYQVVTVEPSAWYEFAAQARIEGQCEAFLRLSWYESADGTGRALAQDDSDVTRSSDWTALSTGSVEAPGEARSARLRLVLRPSAAAPCTAFFDAVRFERAAPAPEPEDAPSPRSRRNGTSSTSATFALPLDVPQASVGPVRLSEVYPNPDVEENEAAHEWVELVNTGAEPVSLAGWLLGDAKQLTPLPAVELPPGGYLVVAGPAAVFPEGTAVVRVASRIGNGLNNGGEIVRLVDATGATVDLVAYGDQEVWPGAPPAPEEGESLVRWNLELSGPDAWLVALQPTPGRPGPDIAPAPPDAAPEEPGTPPPRSGPPPPATVVVERGARQGSALPWIVIGAAAGAGAVGAVQLAAHQAAPLVERWRKKRERGH